MGNPSTVAGEAKTASGGSVELTGAVKRKRGRPPTRKVDKTPPTVKDELSSKCIGEKVKRKKKPGKHLVSPFKALEPSKPG
jgi:hypothetical protein